MTTIAYRAGVLACDSMWTLGDVRSPEKSAKMWKFADGSAAAMCGDYAGSLKLLNWMRSRALGADAPRPMVSNATVVHLQADGVLVIYEEGDTDPYALDAEYLAWGSGFQVALGALYMGATAEDAVRASCQFNVNTALPVLIHTLPGVKIAKPQKRAKTTARNR